MRDGQSAAHALYRAQGLPQEEVSGKTARNGANTDDELAVTRDRDRANSRDLKRPITARVVSSDSLKLKKKASTDRKRRSRPICRCRTRR